MTVLLTISFSDSDSWSFLSKCETKEDIIAMACTACESDEDDLEDYYDYEFDDKGLKEPEVLGAWDVYNGNQMTPYFTMTPRNWNGGIIKVYVISINMWGD